MRKLNITCNLPLEVQIGLGLVSSELLLQMVVIVPAAHPTIITSAHQVQDNILKAPMIRLVLQVSSKHKCTSNSSSNKINNLNLDKETMDSIESNIPKVSKKL